MKISAIILASGFSKRMPQNKLKLLIREKKVYQYIIDNIEKIEFAEKIIVTNDSRNLTLCFRKKNQAGT